MSDPSTASGTPAVTQRGTHVRWYRSLYWRIGLGLMAFLALMLVAQGALFLWITDRIAGSMPASSPQRLAELVSSDIGVALADEPALDLAQYVRDQFGNVFQAFVVIMRDGRIVVNDAGVSQDLINQLKEGAQRRFEFSQRRLFGRGPGPGEFPGRGDGPRGRFQRRAQFPDDPDDPARSRERLDGPPVPRGNISLIVVGDTVVGEVAVLGRPPLSRIARELGPTMGLVGGGVLVVGVSLIAFIVFGPVRRRLKQVQDATDRLGQGDLRARVPDRGGDEVAAVAGSFNRMAEELAARAEALQSSDLTRRQLLADVSHELNTPLTAMRGYLETLSMPDLDIDADTRTRYLGIVTEESYRLERIVGDLLDLARLEGGGISLRHSTVDVSSLLDRVAERHGREMTSRNVQLMIRVSEDARTVDGDPDRLEQAIQNLAANALRHTPDGGTMTLSGERVGDHVRLSVRDSGPGIAPEHLPKIFDRFYKVDMARKATGGSGLGLSIAKAIVERHGGSISARNDNGAVFEVFLPVSAR
ncbi:MAG: HAMP domain-containing protein [Acidobacteria bacterium]|nr:HAMP domain-containing protein [Acidobacteriota bacterium]